MNNSSTLTISSSTLFALAKQSKNLGAYKMARTAYDKLQVSEVCHCHLKDTKYYITRLLALKTSFCGFEVVV